MRYTNLLITAAVVCLCIGKTAGALLKVPSDEAGAFANRKRLEPRQALAQRCAQKGVSCLSTTAGMFLPEPTGVVGCQPKSTGGDLCILDSNDARGTAQCDESTVAWHVRRGTGAKVLDARDADGRTNKRITGWFSNDPSTRTTHGVVTTHVAGVDLILQCQTADRHHVNASASLERRETLAEQCALFGVMCLNIGPGMFIPNEEGVAGSEKQSDGSLLLLLDTEGGKGNAQCNDSTVLWNMRMNPGEKEFDGRDQNGARNRRITGWFSDDPSTRSTHGVIKSKVEGVDLVLRCNV